MKCNVHHIEYGGPYCPRCIGDMALSNQGGVTRDEVRQIVREELERARPSSQPDSSQVQS